MDLLDEKRDKSAEVDEKSKLKPGPRTKKAQKKAQTDVIDKLDATGLYGLGGGGFHHSGPYDAAASRSNVYANTGKRRTMAPINAFHPSALDPAIGHRQSRAYPPGGSPNGRAQPKSNGVGVSARAQAAMSAMNDSGLVKGGGSGPYPSLKHQASEGSLLEPLLNGSSTPTNRSTSSVAMGFPVSQGISAKDAQVMQVWGIREQEAWEDYGRAYEPGMGGKTDKSTSRLTLSSGLSKEERAMRAASVWDMEATLREGKPGESHLRMPFGLTNIDTSFVQVASAPPPVPALPPMPDLTQFSDAPVTHRRGRSKTLTNADQLPGPKRSKSLIQKFRKASKSPNIPMSSSDAEGQPSKNTSLDVPGRNQNLTVSTPTSPLAASGDLTASPTDDKFLSPVQAPANDRLLRSKLTSPSTPELREKPPVSPIVNFAPPLPAPPEMNGSNGELGRKGSIMQRVRSFRKKKDSTRE
ncbi:hypothetical protein BT69DRAFT_1332081 [Atractiella rhizophila]|nr:hypothetical protein BT69DRAFT_1332081 [Atractiella rhizophila]